MYHILRRRLKYIVIIFLVIKKLMKELKPLNLKKKELILKINEIKKTKTTIKY